MESVSDNQLMMKVKSGQLDKLGLLYERYNKILFGFFYRFSGNTENSEDLVQNVFYRILKYRDKFRNEGKFSTWMFHIAHNVNADFYKKNKRLEFSDDISNWNIQKGLSVDEQIEKAEQHRLIKSAINQLGFDQREVLILSRYHELKYKEIAEILNCSEGAVKVRIFRAINELKQIYSKLEK